MNETPQFDMNAAFEEVIALTADIPFANALEREANINDFLCLSPFTNMVLPFAIQRLSTTLTGGRIDIEWEEETLSDMKRLFLYSLWLKWRNDDTNPIIANAFDAIDDAIMWNALIVIDILNQPENNSFLPKTKELPDEALIASSILPIYMWEYAKLPLFQNLISQRIPEYHHSPISDCAVQYVVDLIVTAVIRSVYDITCFCRRVLENPTKLHMFRAITNVSEGFSDLQTLSRSFGGFIPEDVEDALQDWLVKLLSMPLLEQIQKLGVTRKAILERLYDFLKKGGKYEQAPLDDALVDVISDESQEIPDELRKVLAIEVVQRLKEAQKQIEAVLSEEARRKRDEIGERRFKVMVTKLQTELTAEEIAGKLGVSEQTIDDDWAEYKKKREVVQEILLG